MTLLHQRLFARFMAPTDGDAGGGGGDAGDRGDDFLPTGDDADAGDAAKEPAKADAEKADDKGVEAEKEADKEADKKDEDDKAEDKPKKRYVPEERMNQAVQKHKNRAAALEARIKELEGQVGATKTSEDIELVENELDKLQDEYEDALADGKKAEAKAIRGKIRGYESRLIDLKASERANAAKVETIEELRYEQAIAQIEKEYPTLNPDDTEHFDEEKMAEVLELRNALVKNGNAPTKALQRAVKLVLGAPGLSKEDADKAKTDREKAAREKAADALKKTPADMAKVGNDSDKHGGTIDVKAVSKMTQDQFAKLDQDLLARLRGDVL